MTEPVDLLQQLDFSEYEAKAYLALLRESPLNGYELARLSGLPRGNVYAVLEKLEKRGAVVRMDTPEGMRYAPVPPAEMLQQIKTRLLGTLDQAAGSLDEIARVGVTEHVWNIQGYSAMIAHAAALVEEARESLLLAVQPPESAALGKAVSSASQRGISPTTLCLENCPVPCGSCFGALFRYQINQNANRRWLIVVADGEEMLAGQIESGGQNQAIRTRQPLLTQLSAGYVSRSIAMVVLLQELEERLGGPLSLQASAALESLGDMGLSEEWLEHINALMETSSDAGFEKGGDDREM